MRHEKLQSLLQLTRPSLSKSASEMFKQKRSQNVRVKFQTTFNNSKTEYSDRTSITNLYSIRKFLTPC